MHREDAVPYAAASSNTNRIQHHPCQHQRTSYCCRVVSSIQPACSGRPSGGLALRAAAPSTLGRVGLSLWCVVVASGASSYGQGSLWSPGLGVLASRRHDQRELLCYARVLWVCSTTSTPSLQTWPRCSAVSYTTRRPSYGPGIGRRGLTSTRPTIYSPSPSGVAAPRSGQSGPVGG